ncbi:hypothetical protein VTK56DRAFT_3620 [Thermocarpiscus australiensis]
MVEALDAAIRSVDLALSAHQSFPRSMNGTLREDTQRLLSYRGELFQSTKLGTYARKQGHKARSISPLATSSGRCHRT